MDNADFVKFIDGTGFGAVAREVGLVGPDALLPAHYIEPRPAPPPEPAPPPAPASPTPEVPKDALPTPAPPVSKRRRTAKAQESEEKPKDRGLRHFSQKVCAKVEEKGCTTYNEVADDLVRDFAAAEGRRPGGERPFDEKNIRRRVYDALNVLMAMDVISKEKKEITWRGLPSRADEELQAASKARDAARSDVRRKRRHVADLLRQRAALGNLVTLNKKRHVTANPSPEAAEGRDGVLALPFIAVATRPSTTVRCEVTDDRREVFLDFSAPFEIHDDADVLLGLGLHERVPAVPEAATKLPPKLPTLPAIEPAAPRAKSPDDSLSEPEPAPAPEEVAKLEGAEPSAVTRTAKGMAPVALDVPPKEEPA